MLMPLVPLVPLTDEERQLRSVRMGIDEAVWSDWGRRRTQGQHSPFGMTGLGVGYAVERS